MQSIPQQEPVVASLDDGILTVRIKTCRNCHHIRVELKRNGQHIFNRMPKNIVTRCRWNGLVDGKTQSAPYPDFLG